MLKKKNIRTFFFLCALVIGLGAFYVSSYRFNDHALEDEVNRCRESIDTAKIQCWEDVIREVLKKEGIEQSFRLVSHLYDSDAEFARSCHAMVHIIGQTAYSQFQSTGSVPLTESAASCAFGFYHGFMEMLIARKGAIVQAQEFCSYVDKTLGEITPNAKYGCYHGIGHGSTDVHNPKYYGDELALIAPALGNCEAFAQNDEQLTLCATGVFDSISIAYYNDGQNGLVMKKDDPLWLCHVQPDRYKEACYRDMMPAVIWMGEHDLVKATPIVMTHVEDQYKAFSLEILAENSMRFIMKTSSHATYVPFCQSLDEPFRSRCIVGIASGVMQFGPPGKEYEGALMFCGDSMLSSQEQDRCMEHVLVYAEGRYSKKKMREICQGVPDEYQKYCDK